jgi:phosphoribosylglycinamide formyltransferase-1
MTGLALWLTGSGTTAEAVVKAKDQLGELHPVIAIASRSEAPGIVKMKALGIPVAIVKPTDYKNSHEFGEALIAVLDSVGASVISQNGWLPLTPKNVIAKFEGRIINQHPGPLDPGRADFGGAGMYGRRVTAARVAFAWMTGDNFQTESTVHHVSEHFDEGPLIRTEILTFNKRNKMTGVEIRENAALLMKAVEDVTNKLLPIEHANVLAALKTFGTKGSFDKTIRNVPLVSEGYYHVLAEAKQIALELFPKG